MESANVSYRQGFRHNTGAPLSPFKEAGFPATLRSISVSDQIAIVSFEKATVGRKSTELNGKQSRAELIHSIMAQKYDSSSGLSLTVTDGYAGHADTLSPTHTHTLTDCQGLLINDM